jgi:hypothetical protein
MAEMEKEVLEASERSSPEAQQALKQFMERDLYSLDR